MFKFFSKRSSVVPEPEVDLSRWNRNPNNAKRLDDILRDPIFRQAVAITKAQQAPYGAKTIGSTPEVNANLANWWAGFHDFLPALSALATPRNQAEKATPDQDQEWMHLQNQL